MERAEGTKELYLLYLGAVVAQIEKRKIKNELYFIYIPKVMTDIFTTVAQNIYAMKKSMSLWVK